MPLSGAFSLDAARESGLTRAQLLGKRWRRLGPSVYATREIVDGPLLRLKAATLRLPDIAVFSGHTAAFLHRLVQQLNAIEATLPAASHISRRVGMTIRRRRLDPGEVVVRMGFRVTSALRTVIDVASRAPLVDAVVIIDAALHRRLVSVEQLSAISKLKRAVTLADPATESPMETRRRLLLVLAGLPRPLVNVPLRDALARADLCYPDQRLVIEYDGATHRDIVGADDRRQNRLINAGYRVIRFTASDVLGDPASVVAVVGRAVGYPAVRGGLSL